MVTRRASHRESNTISIWNNGKGIPVVEHKDEKMYVPALIFGHLLTSSNYDDEEKKVTGESSGWPSDPGSGVSWSAGANWAAGTSGGRNGYGAKLCNIFSTKFTVETACKEYRHSFKQVSRSPRFPWQHSSTTHSSGSSWVSGTFGKVPEPPT